jgi:formin-binding protein 4
VDAIPQPYIAQENVGYTISGMEYYGIVGTEGTNANYYMQVSEPHVLQAQQHSYYAPVSGSGVSVSVDGTSIAPESYYTHPSVTMAASAVAAEHSVYYASSISAISSSAADIKTSSASLVSANSNSDLKGPDKLISNDASIVPLTQAVVATSGAGTPSVLGSSTQPSSSTKNLTKGNPILDLIIWTIYLTLIILFDLLCCSVVTRNKKRAVGITSSLRSNKKVSSLVDKVALYNRSLLHIGANI